VRPFGQARDHAHDELLRGALTVEDRAVGLIKISAARDALARAPGLTTMLFQVDDVIR